MLTYEETRRPKGNNFHGASPLAAYTMLELANPEALTTILLQYPVSHVVTCDFHVHILVQSVGRKMSSARSVVWKKPAKLKEAGNFHHISVELSSVGLNKTGWADERTNERTCVGWVGTDGQTTQKDAQIPFSTGQVKKCRHPLTMTIDRRVTKILSVNAYKIVRASAEF